MFGPKLKISKELMEKMKLASDHVGCSSVDEFVESVLEREADRINREIAADKISKEEVDDITEKLKGLGYID